MQRVNSAERQRTAHNQITSKTFSPEALQQDNSVLAVRFHEKSQPIKSIAGRFLNAGCISNFLSRRREGQAPQIAILAR